MGLDKDDTIVKRRMAQKMRFLAEDVAAGAANPTRRSWRRGMRRTPTRSAAGRVTSVSSISPRTGAASARAAEAEKALAKLAGQPVDSTLAASFSEILVLGLAIARPSSSPEAAPGVAQAASAPRRAPGRGRWSPGSAARSSSSIRSSPGVPAEVEAEGEDRMLGNRRRRPGPRRTRRCARSTRCCCQRLGDGVERPRRAGVAGGAVPRLPRKGRRDSAHRRRRAPRRALLGDSARSSCPAAHAHESRPAYLESRGEPRPASSPSSGARRGHADAPGAEDARHVQNLKEPVVQELADSLKVDGGRSTPGPTGSPQRIDIVGLQFTITDALVRVSTAGRGGPSPARRSRGSGGRLPGLGRGGGDVPRRGCAAHPAWRRPPVFVLGLLLIVADRWMLVKTITSFTVAHSITLAIATLGYASAPLLPLNAAIALWILFLGPEIVRAWRGETSFTIRHPWVVAFAFGLLHGFGFASGLTAMGLPRAEIPLALLLFNVGVEVGQLFFVALIVLLERAFRTLEIGWPRWSRRCRATRSGRSARTGRSSARSCCSERCDERAAVRGIGACGAAVALLLARRPRSPTYSRARRRAS